MTSKDELELIIKRLEILKNLQMGIIELSTAFVELFGKEIFDKLDIKTLTNHSFEEEIK